MNALNRPRRTLCALCASVVMPLLLAIPAAVPIPVVAQQAPNGIPGVFTDSQATRGQQWYDSQCAACHPSRDMSSNDFKLRWNGRNALDLYLRIATTMPATSPGTLSRRTYTDIVAYLMRINGLPAGTAVLTADSTVMGRIPLAFAGLPTPTR